MVFPASVLRATVFIEFCRGRVQFNADFWHRVLLLVRKYISLCFTLSCFPRVTGKCPFGECRVVSFSGIKKIF